MSELDRIREDVEAFRAEVAEQKLKDANQQSEDAAKITELTTQVAQGAADRDNLASELNDIQMKSLAVPETDPLVAFNGDGLDVMVTSYSSALSVPPPPFDEPQTMPLPIQWGYPTVPRVRDDNRPIVQETSVSGDPEYVVYIYPSTNNVPFLLASTTDKFRRVILDHSSGVPNVNAGTLIPYVYNEDTWRATANYGDGQPGDITDVLVNEIRSGWTNLMSLGTIRQMSVGVADPGTLWPLNPDYLDIIAIAGTTLDYELGDGVNLATTGVQVSFTSFGKSIDVDYGTEQPGSSPAMNPSTSAKGLIVEKVVRCN